MSAAVVVALITSGLAAIGGIASAVISAHTRNITAATRQENSDQHLESQSKLELLAQAVHQTGGKVDGLRSDVSELHAKHDGLAEKFHRHLGHHDAHDLEED